MVNEAEFAAMKAAKKAAKAAKAAGTAGEAQKQQRKEERKKRKAGSESSAAGDGSAPADDSTSDSYAVVNAAASRGPLQDQTVCCIDCGTDFVFSVEEHGHSGPLGSAPAQPLRILTACLASGPGPLGTPIERRARSAPSHRLVR